MKYVFCIFLFICGAQTAWSNELQKTEYIVVMVTKDGCGYCVKQKRILEQDNERIPFNIREVNVTNRPDFVDRYQIQVTPTLLLLTNKSDDYIHLTSGVESVDYIISRVNEGFFELQKRLPAQNNYLF